MKLKLIWAFILLFFIIFQVFGISQGELDRLFNLNAGLRDLSTSFEKGESAKYKTDQFIIVIGSIASLNPQKNSSYLITENELSNPMGFVKLFKNPSDSFSRAIVNGFSSRFKKTLDETELTDKTLDSLLRDLLREFSRIFRREIFYQPGLERQIPISAELLALLTQTQPAEEMGFLNRLIFELAYPGHIKKYQIVVSLQDGEWLNYDEVKTYEIDVIFTGVECYKIFTRRDETRAVQEYIPLNSKAMIIASLIKPVQKDEYQVWQANGYYIRLIP